MKNPIIYLVITFLSLATSCSTPKGAEKPVISDNAINNADLQGIEGSWKLVKFKEAADTVYTSWPQEINPKIKLVTNTHFTWVSYDENSVIASGGGTYDYNGENYVENIDFFERAEMEDADLTGTSVNFNCSIVGDKWYHSGYAKEYELNPESLEYVVIDSFWIDEIWERM